MGKYYSCEEVAEHFRVKTETVWTWIREKHIAAIRVGRGYRIPESALLAFEKANSTITTEKEDVFNDNCGN